MPETRIKGQGSVYERSSWSYCAARPAVSGCQYQATARFDKVDEITRHIVRKPVLQQVKACSFWGWLDRPVNAHFQRSQTPPNLCLVSYIRVNSMLFSLVQHAFVCSHMMGWSGVGWGGVDVLPSLYCYRLFVILCYASLKDLSASV